MLELRPTRADVVACLGTGVAVDRAVAAGWHACRVAPDEALLIGAPGTAGAMAAAATAACADADPDAVVLDVTDGWSAWTLDGVDVDRAMARLSRLELPTPGWIQGDVARVPVKAFVDGGRVHLFVPAMWEAHLRDRVLTRCASLEVREHTEPLEWVGP